MITAIFSQLDTHYRDENKSLPLIKKTANFKRRL